jgi:hypothetical protein
VTAAPAPKKPSPPPAKKTVARKTVANKAPATEASPVTPSPQPSPQPPLAEKPVSLQHLAKVSPDERLAMINEAAYFKAENRNFAPGHESEDWAEAEREIDELLAQAKKIYGA